MKREDLHPSTITIKELFSYDKPYIIPGYQRPYEWNRKQIENMLNTIIEAFESKKQDALLFGTIQFNVVEKNGEQTEKDIIGDNCEILWEGVLKSRVCDDWKIHEIKSEADAIRLLSQKGLENMWNLIK